MENKIVSIIPQIKQSTPTKKKDDTTEILNFVNKLFQDSVVESVDPKDVALATTHTEEYLRIVRDRTAVQASLGLPGTIDAITEKAQKGDLDAAKLLLDIVGVIPKGNSSPQNAIQINITPSEQAQLEKDFADFNDRL
jgi:hypothetical protein